MNVGSEFASAASRAVVQRFQLVCFGHVGNASCLAVYVSVIMSEVGWGTI